MKKTHFTILIFFVVALSISSASAQIYSDVDTISIVPTNGSPGDTIAVHINCVNTFSIQGVLFRLTFDDDVFEVVSVDLMPRSSGFSINNFIFEMPGVIRYVGAAFSNPWENLILPGTGPINSLNLRVLNNAPNGDYFIRFENVDSTSFENHVSDSLGFDIVIPVFNDGIIGIWPTGIDDNSLIQPSNFDLLQNYPNPFNMETKISFVLENRSEVTLDVFNLLGKKVATLFDGEADAGKTSVRWNGVSSEGSEVSSGVYFYKVSISDGRSITKRMALIK